MIIIDKIEYDEDVIYIGVFDRNALTDNRTYTKEKLQLLRKDNPYVGGNKYTGIRFL